MTADDLHQVRKSFAKVEAMGHVGALLFYQRLFEVAPQVRPLFSTEIETQSKKLTQMLTAVIGLAEKPEEFRATLEDLGARHVDYGALPGHYPVVVDSLLHMLEKVLGPEFTPKLRSLWTGVLNTIAQMMMNGAEKAVRVSSTARCQRV